MPKISELDNADPLLGPELLVVVQDGITLKSNIDALLSLRRAPSISAARWIKSSQSEGLIAETALINDGFDNFSALAIVSFSKNDDDTLVWDFAFSSEPPLINSSSLIGDYEDGSSISLDAAKYSVSLYNSGPSFDGVANLSGPVTCLLGTVGESCEFTLDYGSSDTLYVACTNGAIVRVFRTGFYDGSGYLPEVLDLGERVNVRYVNASPRAGTLTLSARLVDSNNVDIATSNAITLQALKVVDNSQQGY